MSVCACLWQNKRTICCVQRQSSALVESSPNLYYSDYSEIFSSSLVDIDIAEPRICLYVWMAVSIVVVLVILLGMLLSPNCHQQKECGQVFLMAWMEKFFK
ncbi:hypothetical protein Peur_049033 [Populus x canadensis]